MKIHCTACGTGFLLPDDALPPGGAPVECGECGAIFTARRRDDPPVGAPAAAPRATAPPPPARPASASDEPTATAPGPAPAAPAAPEPAAPVQDEPPPAGPEAPADDYAPEAPADDYALGRFSLPGDEEGEPAFTGEEDPGSEPDDSGPQLGPAADVDEDEPAWTDDEGAETSLGAESDPFLRARRRRSRALLVVGGLVLVSAAALVTLYLFAPGVFDDLIGKRVGVRAQWDPEAERLREEAWPLLLRDDRGSLEAAAEILERAHEADPEYPLAATDLAAARFLLAEHIRAGGRRVLDEGNALSRETQQLTARMKNLRGRRRDQLARDAEERIARIQALDARATGIFEEAGGHAQAGFKVARANHTRHETVPYAMAGLALYYALEDELAPAEALLENMRTFGEVPALGHLAEGLLLARGDASPEKRRRALAAFDAALAAEPRMLRAQYGKARALDDLGETEAAAALLAALAAENPDHPAAVAKPAP